VRVARPQSHHPHAFRRCREVLSFRPGEHQVHLEPAPSKTPGQVRDHALDPALA